jgi:hypothetical protein
LEDESVQSCHTTSELLDVLDRLWSIHGLRNAKDTLCQVKIPSKPSQAVESLLEVSDELVMGSGIDDHVIHVSFNVAV